MHCSCMITNGALCDSCAAQMIDALNTRTPDHHIDVSSLGDANTADVVSLQDGIDQWLVGLEGQKEVRV